MASSAKAAEDLHSGEVIIPLRGFERSINDLFCFSEKQNQDPNQLSHTHKHSSGFSTKQMNEITPSIWGGGGSLFPRQ